MHLFASSASGVPNTTSRANTASSPIPPVSVGWTANFRVGRGEKLEDSLKLVRELMVPHWDIHPEMITHTRVIDLNTGRPCEEINAGNDGELVSARKEKRR